MRKIRIPVAIASAVVLVGGAALLFQGISSEPGCAGEGSCMLYFYTDDCLVCQQMTPIVDGLEQKYGRDFKIVRINVATNEGKKLAREQGCIGQPAFVLFDHSGEQIRRLMGAQTNETFEREIERILETPGE